MSSLETFDKRVRDSVVRILKSDKTVIGTGFFVKPNSCLTCYHVIRDFVDQDPPADINVEYDGKTVVARYCAEKSKPEKEVAVLEINVPGAKKLPVARESGRSFEKAVRAYGYRVGFKGFTATGTLRPGTPEFSPTPNLPKGKLHIMETNLPSGATVGGMSGCPVYDLRKQKVVGIQWGEAIVGIRGEETAAPAICYVIPIETVYEKWKELRPSLPRAAAQWVLVETQRWEELPWLIIFLLLIIAPFLFNMWLHSAFKINWILISFIALPILITSVWVLIRSIPEKSLGKLKFLHQPFRIRHPLRIYSIMLAFWSIIGFTDGLGTVSVSMPILKNVFNWGYPTVYRLSKFANFAFTIPSYSSSGEEHDMVYVPAGYFQRGLTEGQQDQLIGIIERDGPRSLTANISPQDLKEEFEPEESDGKPVWLNDYFISKCEVTNAHYQKFLEDNNSKPEQIPRGWKTEWIEKGIPEEYAELPVLVTWDQAREYCRWLSGRAEAKGAKYRLPTEAEWEKAARGEDGCFFPWGNNWEDARANFNVRKCVSAYEYQKGERSGKSCYGCLNMAGNAQEWCQDWYDKNYYLRGHRTNPKGPSEGEKKVVRGGWNRSIYLYKVRSTARLALSPEDPPICCGFRVVKLPSKF